MLCPQVLHFRLGYYETAVKGQPARCVMDGRTIALRYLKFWFWVDSVAIFPWQRFGDDSTSGAADG